ncbi:MAG TPA: hypothetical protein ACQGQF_00945 [Xylella fastidiosa subsp. pauca]
MLSLNPFTYQEEKRSALLHDITPIIASSNFHTDGAYLERHLRPHTLSLLCLVDTSQTGTWLASLQAALPLLSATESDV